MKKFKVYGMSCAACSAKVERAVSAVGGVTECSVNLLTGSMTVVGEMSDSEVICAVKAAGYSAEKADIKTNVNNNIQNSDKTRILWRLTISLSLLVPLMYLSMLHTMLGAPLPEFIANSPILNGVCQMILAAVIMVVNGKFFVNGAKGAFKLAPNMDTLVALGSGASFVYSVSVLVLMAFSSVEAGHGHLHDLYFESAAMILTLITVGKLLEEMAKGKTTNAIRSLMELSPKLATLERDGREIVVAVSEVRVGDVFILRPGDAVPVDGVVLEGESSIIESALTGESVPVDKLVGDKVLAATVNTSGFLRCRAERVGDDTTIAAVIRLVDEASASKAPIAKVADKVSGVFVPFVLLISLVSLVAWLLSGADVGYALGRSISVLVISCPCALGLATPVAIMVGTGVGAKRGILYKSAEAIELIGRAKIVALDKTGTITEGNPTVVDVASAPGVAEDELVKVAYSLEKYSEHPLGRAVASYSEKIGSVECSVSGFAALPGAGVRALVDGEESFGASYKYVRSLIGNNEKMDDDYERLSSEGKTPLFFTRGGRYIGVIATADNPRKDSREAVCALRSLGIRVVMMTGDNKKTAAAIAADVGIGEAMADMLPADKAEHISQLRSEGRVIMVGDGINDAPSLVCADVGIAIGGGTDVAIDSADVVLIGDSLAGVVEAVKLGRRVLKTIYENLFWAFIYNTVGIPLAAGAFVHLLGWEMSPMLGALAMSLSSFSVVMNALRIGKTGGICRGKSRCENAGTVAPCCEKTDIQRINVLKSEAKADRETGEEGNCAIADATVPTDDSNTAGKYNIDNSLEEAYMTIRLKIEGMMCPHCERRVKETLEGADGVISAQVSHKNGEAVVTVTDEVESKNLIALVEAQGYPAFEA